MRLANVTRLGFGLLYLLAAVQAYLLTKDYRTTALELFRRRLR